MSKEDLKLKIVSLGCFLFLCFVLYSCFQDEWEQAANGKANQIISGKNHVLTISAAHRWYESTQLPVVSTRSVVTNLELLTKMNWSKAVESRRGDFEVVEIPLLVRGGAVLLDKETKERYNPETDRKKIRSISRMVIIKNVLTGDITNFVMYIIGTYDYLLKVKHFGRNSYLYRDPHFSGRICFYAPEGGLVNGWKYEDGRIVGRISQGTKEGLAMQRVSLTRSEQDCHYEDVLVESNECEGFVYEDPEYGMGFGTECTNTETWDIQEVCEEVDDDDDNSWYPPISGGGGGSGGGSTGGGYHPVAVAPKAKAIFRNSSMTDINWAVIENMLKKIMSDCMGEALYNGLKKTLNGKTLKIQFIDNGNSAFTLDGGIRLRIDGVSGDFLHEMLHAYQSYQENYDSMMDAKINMEIETHYAQYIYQHSLPEYKGSKWEKRDKTTSRWKEISKLTKYIDSKGNLHPNADISEFESRILNQVVPALRQAGYSSDKYPLDYDRPGLENFKNIRELTENC